MADFGHGNPVTVGFRVTDTDGSPITAGVTGTVTVLGPGGTVALAATAVAHLGDGGWGVTVPSTATGVSGLYRATAASLTNGAVTLTNQVALFTVGQAVPAFKTLRDLLVGIYDELNDGVYGTTDALGSTTTFTDSALANNGSTADEFVGSEVLFLAPGSVADRNPVNVTSWVPATGVFTFAPAVASNVATGKPYLLCNLRGQGYRYREVRAKIIRAWREISPRQHVVDDYSLTMDGSYNLGVPSQWREVTAVALRQSSSLNWADVAPMYAQYDGQSRVIRFTHKFPSSESVKLEGLIDYAEPNYLNSVVQVPYGWVVDRVLGEIWAGSRDRALQQRAAVHLQRAERGKPRM